MSCLVMSLKVNLECPHNRFLYLYYIPAEQLDELVWQLELASGLSSYVQLHKIRYCNATCPRTFPLMPVARGVVPSALLIDQEEPQ
jgi:hypothetical protein